MKINMKFASTVVLIVIGLNVWFADRVFDVIEKTGIEPTVITPLWFAFTTGELWMLKDIKKKKIDKEVKNNDRQSED